MKNISLFDVALSVPLEDSDVFSGCVEAIPWADYLLNPRRLRGSDFLMRWSQGRWSEERIVQAIEDTGQYFAVPYGPSGPAPEGDAKEIERYFERLERTGWRTMKRPDLLVFRGEERAKVSEIISELGTLQELPFTSEEDMRVANLRDLAVMAVECENSLWKARQMPDFGVKLTPQKRLGGKLGLKKTAVVPTVILKNEDREPLKEWQLRCRVPVHIWHVFYDIAFGIALDDAEDLIRAGAIAETSQVFQAPSGATTRKSIYKIYYHYAYVVGEATQEPHLRAEAITDKNGHVLPYVTFHGGRLTLSSETVTRLRELAASRFQTHRT